MCSLPQCTCSLWVNLLSGSLAWAKARALKAKQQANACLPICSHSAADCQSCLPPECLKKLWTNRRQDSFRGTDQSGLHHMEKQPRLKELHLWENPACSKCHFAHTWQLGSIWLLWFIWGFPFSLRCRCLWNSFSTWVNIFLSLHNWDSLSGFKTHYTFRV